MIKATVVVAKAQGMVISATSGGGKELYMGQKLMRGASTV